MRFTRAAPARPTSSRTWPIVRRSAPLTASSSGSGAFGRVLLRFAILAERLTFFRAGFFRAMCLSLIGRCYSTLPPPRLCWSNHESRVRNEGPFGLGSPGGPRHAQRRATSSGPDPHGARRQTGSVVGEAALSRRRTVERG